MSFAWTPENEATLRRLHAEGHSSSQIAKQIGGPSRNAVIGKVHRLGLVRAKKPQAQALARPKAPAPATHHPRNVARKTGAERREHFEAVADKALGKFEATVPASTEPVRFLDRSRFQCAMPQAGWENTPVAEKMVCGQAVASGTSWCPACLKRVSSPSTFAAFKHRKMVGGLAA